MRLSGLGRTDSPNSPAGRRGSGGLKHRVLVLLAAAGLGATGVAGLARGVPPILSHANDAVLSPAAYAVLSPTQDTIPSPAASAGPSALDEMVDEALRRNRSLAQERFRLDEARAAQREAIGLYLPSLSVHARFSHREGNITDIGRLINPAYAALNGVIGQDAFPTDIDAKLPTRQETSLRLTQPLFELRIAAAIRAASGARQAQEARVGAAARTIAAGVRIGYLEYAKARRLSSLYDSTLVLVREVVRVQRSLLDHGKATPDQVLRAQADESEYRQRRLEAGRLAEAARQSLNLLLGRPVDAPLEALPEEDLGLELDLSLDSALASARAGREEMAAIRGELKAARGQVSAADAGYWPSLVAAWDWGYQGEEYRFGRDDDYSVASLVLQWDLLDGGRREARRGGARADLARARAAEEELRESIDLDVRTAWESASTAREALASARSRLDAARRAYELTVRRHGAGGASLLELLDARTTFTAAAVNEAVTTYEYAGRCADLARAAAIYPARP